MYARKKHRDADAHRLERKEECKELLLAYNLCTEYVMGPVLDYERVVCFYQRVNHNLNAEGVISVPWFTYSLIRVAAARYTDSAVKLQKCVRCERETVLWNFLKKVIRFFGERIHPDFFPFLFSRMYPYFYIRPFIKYWNDPIFFMLMLLGCKIFYIVF